MTFIKTASCLSEGCFYKAVLIQRDRLKKILICLNSPILQRVHLDIQVGEHTNNYPEIAAKDKLTELQLRVRQLLDQVEQIQKEQNYQRVRTRVFY